MKYSAMPRCCRFFVSPRREEGAYLRRSVTDEQRWRGEKSGATRRARTLWAVWRRCSLLIPPPRDGHARRSRLAIQPKAFSRHMAAYFNRLPK
jgi:hypothetical protein